jgi:hypothetical protein
MTIQAQVADPSELRLPVKIGDHTVELTFAEARGLLFELCAAVIEVNPNPEESVLTGALLIILRDNVQLQKNLDETQARCTALLEEVRRCRTAKIETLDSREELGEGLRREAG